MDMRRDRQRPIIILAGIAASTILLSHFIALEPRPEPLRQTREFYSMPSTRLVASKPVPPPTRDRVRREK